VFLVLGEFRTMCGGYNQVSGANHT
jgi:hypothetical protein